MHPNVTKAVVRLQTSLRITKNPRKAEQTEEALNLLLNQPNNTAAPPILIRNAMSEASKKLTTRQRLFAVHRERELRQQTDESRIGTLAFELQDFVEYDVRSADRPYLRLALQGLGAEEIARGLNLPIDRTRERLSRARSAAYPLWIN